MQISAVSPVQAPTIVERNASSPAPTPDQIQAQVTEARAKKAEVEVAANKVFTPAPPLRPNVQDYVDINRTLLALRKL